MAFFDKVKEAGAKGYDKAKELGEIGKYKLEIASLESKMKDVYTEIGMNIFYVHPEIAEQYYKEQSDTLLEYANRVSELNAKIDAIKKVEA